MKRRGAMLLQVSWASLGLTVGLYLACPTPPHGPMPTIHALSAYKHWGCGLSRLTQSGTTVFYPDLHADDRLRQALRTELIPKGYRELDRDGAVTFRKPIRGGLYPIHSWVLVGEDGTVVSGITRRKWPFW